MEASKQVGTRKIQRSELSVEELVEILRSRIINNELPPGAMLQEVALTEEYRVSRPRVREAVRVLEDRGLIERIPNRGARVARLQIEQICELFEVQEVLEGLAVRLGTTKCDPNSWCDLLELFGEKAEEALARNDLDYYVYIIDCFRKRCKTAAANTVLASQLDAIYDRTRVVIRRMMLIPGRAHDGLAQHRKILAAMRDGEPERAEELKRRNIRNARECFEAHQKFLL